MDANETVKQATTMERCLLRDARDMEDGMFAVGESETLRTAATLIESLRAMLNTEHAELSRIKKAISEKGGTEYAPTEDAYLAVCAALTNAKSMLEATIAGQETLQRALAESRKRERAEVRALKDIAKNGTVACNYCARRKGWQTCQKCEFSFSMDDSPQQAGEVEQ